MLGTVTFFNVAKGVGFIKPDGAHKDVFVHVNSVKPAGIFSLSEGRRVSFDIQADARGTKAVNVKSE
jgi:CspA family cold shock protein